MKNRNFRTKKEAIKLARKIRKQGGTAKVFTYNGWVTIPGKGKVPLHYYFVR